MRRDLRDPTWSIAEGDVKPVEPKMWRESVAFYHAFNEICETRQEGFSRGQAISYAEIKAWAWLDGGWKSPPMRSALVKIVRAMDRTIREHAATKAEAGTHAKPGMKSEA